MFPERAAHLSVADRSVNLESGAVLTFDRVILCTGAIPKQVPSVSSNLCLTIRFVIIQHTGTFVNKETHFLSKFEMFVKNQNTSQKEALVKNRNFRILTKGESPCVNSCNILVHIT